MFNSSTFGIGDTSQSLILSPTSSGIKDFSPGLGPIVTVPTASNLILGYRQGAARSRSGCDLHAWSLGDRRGGQQFMVSRRGSARNSVNFFIQPFINYNIPHGQGWYVGTGPIITADWNAHLARDGPFLWVAALAVCSNSPARHSMRKWRHFTTLSARARAASARPGTGSSGSARTAIPEEPKMDVTPFPLEALKSSKTVVQARSYHIGMRDF